VDTWWSNMDNALNKIEKALVVAQHHYAISGTSHKNVTTDYIKMMFEGSHDNYEIVANISKQYFNETFNEDLNVNYCQNNVSSYQCKQLFTTTKDNGDTVVKNL